MRDPLKDHYWQRETQGGLYSVISVIGSRLWVAATRRNKKDPKRAGVLPFDSARCVRANRSPVKRIAVWQAIEVSAHPVTGRRIVAATVIRICSSPLSLSWFLCHPSRYPAATRIRAGTRQQARVNAKPGCLPWRGARLISRAKPAGSKDIGTDCFRLCCSPALSKRPTGTLVRFLIKPAL